MGEVVETDMYFINAADGDYIVYLLCGFPGFKQKRSGRSAVDRFYKSLDLADGFEIRQHDDIGLAGENAFEFIRKAVKIGSVRTNICAFLTADFTFGISEMLCFDFTESQFSGASLCRTVRGR